MPKRRKKSSKINKLLILLAFVCLGIALFGAYTYVQDMRASDAVRLTASNEKASGQSNETPEEDKLEEEAGDDEKEESFEDLDNEIESQVKLSLLESVSDQEAATPQSTPIMNISFNSYNPDKQAYSLGVVFVKEEGAVKSCSLVIQSNKGNVSSQATKTAGQRDVSGCRFNDVELVSLAMPSKISPWRIIIRGHGSDGQAVVSLERNVLSTADLNSLLGS